MSLAGGLEGRVGETEASNSLLRAAAVGLGGKSLSEEKGNCLRQKGLSLPPLTCYNKPPHLLVRVEVSPGREQQTLPSAGSACCRFCSLRPGFDQKWAIRLSDQAPKHTNTHILDGSTHTGSCGVIFENAGQSNQADSDEDGRGNKVFFIYGMARRQRFIAPKGMES